jgi:hypothetical protein
MSLAQRRLDGSPRHLLVALEHRAHIGAVSRSCSDGEAEVKQIRVMLASVRMSTTAA